MAIGNENVGPAVKIVIEKEAGKTQGEQGSATDRRTRRFIHKKAVPLIVIKRHHLVGKIADDNAGSAGTVVISSVHSHTSARHAIFTEGDARWYCLLTESSVAIVQVKLIGLSVV